ncbi:MAG: FAD-dependent oxidoreductase, partial [Planctomycetaceae bacterium]|nr:FAD-dependent oxidoreductase [Planctomycetaceae bacterium]
VRPLRLFIPVRSAWSGLRRSAIGFFGLRRTEWGRALEGPAVPRGYWPTRIGLSMYDWLSGSQAFPASEAVDFTDPGVPHVDRSRYAGMLAYSDAQMLYPERFILALLADAVHIAASEHVPLEVLTRRTVSWEQGRLRLTADNGTATDITPALIVNATGAWGDRTLQSLRVDHPPLFGGTKGSHIVTWNAELKAALGEHAIYAEAGDGRLVFVLPFGDAVLIGTTDESFTGSPGEVVATPAELAYLLKSVHDVFGITLTDDDITAHYCGVRPLPVQAGSNASISRDHSLTWQAADAIPILTLVGGKLTTWRAFAEEAVTAVLQRLQRIRLEATATRMVPGHDPLPNGLSPGPELWQFWAMEFQTTPEQVAALWPLYGTRLTTILQATRSEKGRSITGTAWTSPVVRWVIEHEWVTRLEDLVERRLMLAFARELSMAMLDDLADMLIEAGRLNESHRAEEVTACVARLQRFYGRSHNERSPGNAFPGPLL